MNIDNKLNLFDEYGRYSRTPVTLEDCPPADKGNNERASIFMLYIAIESRPFCGGEKVISRSEGVDFKQQPYLFHSMTFKGALS